jgi:hypothetical protein
MASRDAVFVHEAKESAPSQPVSRRRDETVEETEEKSPETVLH